MMYAEEPLLCSVLVVGTWGRGAVDAVLRMKFASYGLPQVVAFGSLL